MEKRKIRTFVTYIEAGMGHIVTADAIADALEKRYGDSFDVVRSYTLRDSENPVLPKYEKYLVGQVRNYSRFPGYCWLQMLPMHLIGSKNTLRLVHYTVFRRATKATIEEYKKQKPECIVLTHYFLLFAACEYRNKYDPNCKVILYCPDNTVHGWWDNRVERIYTNNELATADARRYRFKEDTIREVFYPTRDAVASANGTKEEYRKMFGIPEDKFTVVVADGMYAKAKARKVTMELLKSDLPLTVCVIAGKNEKLKAELEALKDKVKPNITLIPLGFVKEAPELYAASDLFITKAGPNAILDSVMMGTPILVDYYATPVEKVTMRLFVKEKKCGYYITSMKKIREKVESLIGDRTELDEMKKNLAFFDKTKNGGVEIADDIAALYGVKEEATV